jgi:hypothetical protein
MTHDSLSTITNKSLILFKDLSGSSASCVKSSATLQSCPLVRPGQNATAAENTCTETETVPSRAPLNMLDRWHPTQHLVKYSQV